MFWKFGAAIVAVALAATVCAAQGTEYVDAKAGYRVTIPKGWTQKRSPDDDQLVVRSPNTNTTFGYCHVNTTPMPTEHVSQLEIDRRLAGKITVSFWRKFYETGFRNLVVESAGEEVQNGRTTYYAVMTFKQIRGPHRMKVVEHYLPGVKHSVTCDAYLEHYARDEPAFETFFDSFTPNVPVASN